MNEDYLSIQNKELRRHQFLQEVRACGSEENQSSSQELLDLGRTRALVRGLLDLRRTEVCNCISLRRRLYSEQVGAGTGGSRYKAALPTKIQLLLHLG